MKSINGKSIKANAAFVKMDFMIGRFIMVLKIHAELLFDMANY